MPGGWKEGAYIDEITHLFEQSDQIEKVREFGPNITVYLFKGVNGDVMTPDSFALVGGTTDYRRVDTVLQQMGPYISLNGKALGQAKQFPFAGLTKEELSGVSYDSSGSATTVNLMGSFNLGMPGTIVLPGLSNGMTFSSPATVTYDGKTIRVYFDKTVEILIDGNRQRTYQLDTLKLDTLDSWRTLWVSVNGTQVKVVRGGEAQLAQVPVVVGRPVRLAVYEGDQSRVINIHTQFLTNQVSKCWEREGAAGKHTVGQG